jgi:hypothetical protein
MSCPRCGADHMAIKIVYCKTCGKLIRLVCTACNEVLKEQPCDCTQKEVPGDSASKLTSFVAIFQVDLDNTLSMVIIT